MTFDVRPLSLFEKIFGEQNGINMSEKFNSSQNGRLSSSFVAALALSPLAVFNAQAQVTANDAASSQAFFSSRYGYCDAKKLSSVWNVDVFSGKLAIGNKILRGIPEVADGIIARAARIPCSWDETNLTFEDAQALASHWGRSVVQAKAQATEMVSQMGTKRFRDTVLARVKR